MQPAPEPLRLRDWLPAEFALFGFQNKNPKVEPSAGFEVNFRQPVFRGYAMAKHSKRGHPGPVEFNPARLTTNLVCEPKSAKDPRIQRALDLLQQNHALQSNEVAIALNLSSSRFRHLFKKELGISPHYHLTWTRLHRARELLENSFLRVKEVAALVGVNDL